jgi:hypothetical protein
LLEPWNFVLHKVLESIEESTDFSFLVFSAKIFFVLFIPVVDFLDLAFKSFSFGRNRGVAFGSIGNFLLEFGDGSLCSSPDGVYSISELQFN